MNDLAIRAEGVSKRYQIGSPSHGKARLTEALARALRGVTHVRRARGNGLPRGDEQHIWALKDVSFELGRGEVLGVIGRNGAGKSTLLKIMSGITTPTEGRIQMQGRTGSLLEVGTGFHPELTGRENVWLNGAVLGMKRSEIDRKFDEIVSFAEIGRFIDTPVKRYSSGMQVRLAFAVAAHLEPELLLVDEVLAVGDAAFQKKCLGRMNDVSRQGRTVVFVSHNTGAILSLTQKCLWLDAGRLKEMGPTHDVVDTYLGELLDVGGTRRPDVNLFHRHSIIDSPVHISRIWTDDSQNELQVLSMGENFTIAIEVSSSIELSGAILGIGVKRRDGVSVFVSLSIDKGFRLVGPAGTHTVECHVNGLVLPPGHYLVEIGLSPNPGTPAWDVVLDYPLLSVDISPGKVIHWTDRPWGAVHWDDLTWSVRR